MKKDIAFYVCVAIGTTMLALAIVWVGFMVDGYQSMQGEPTNHHEIISVQTDHKGVVCFIRLDSNKRPQDMSCVHTGAKQWTTPSSPTTAQW